MLSKLIAAAVLTLCLLLPTPASASEACVTETTHEVVLLNLGGYLLPVIATHTTTCCSDNGQISCTVVTTYSIV